MPIRLDPNTVLIVLALGKVLQAAGLLYVWCLHRNYPAARDWVIGSALVAAGVLAVAFRTVLPPHISIVAGNAAIFVGALLFGRGVLKTCLVALPWRSALTLVAISTTAIGWYTLVEPSLVTRTGIFHGTMLLINLYTAIKTLQCRREPFAAMQGFVAALILLQAIAFPMQFFAVLAQSRGVASALSIYLETGFAFITISVTMMVTLALAFLTNLITLNERRQLEVALDKSSRFLRSILESASDVAIIAAEKNLLITVFNSGAERLLGYRADEVIGKLTPAVFADPDEALARSAELTAMYGRPIKGLGIVVDAAVIGENRRWTYVRKDGGRVPVSMTVSAMRDEQGDVIGYLGVAHDITEQIAYERALREAVAQSEEAGRALDTALSNMKQGLAMFDSDKRLIICNENYLSPYGLSKADVQPGTPFADIVRMRIAKGYCSDGGPEKYLAGRLLAMDAMLRENHEDLCQLSDGRQMRLNGHRLEAGGCVVTSEDVTELKRAETRISYLAQHDALTGLANRAQFTQAIETAAARLTADGTPFSVLMLDLDRFKSINDTLGHAAGDALLKEVALRIKSSVRETDVVARLGGDEFAIIQSDLRNDDAEGGSGTSGKATYIALRILEILRLPIVVGGKMVFAGTSIGIASAPTDGTSPDELLKCADFALYQSKSAGRNSYRIFNSEMMAATKERDELEADMRAGLERDEFVLYYQPIVEARTREVAAVEAVMHWNHPVRGLLPSGQFMAIAEQSGLIVPLGEHLIRRACRDAADWPKPISLAFNLWSAQFRKSDLLAVINSALVVSGLTPRRLEVEVTESVLHEDDGRFIETLQQLRAMGVSVSLDHFGTGYTSFAYLTKFQFDKIKIDGVFTKAVVGSVEGMMIVSAACSLARGLNMVSIGDDVETEDQLEILRAAGISLAQGGLFGNPRPIAELQFDNANAPTAASVAICAG